MHARHQLTRERALPRIVRIAVSTQRFHENEQRLPIPALDEGLLHGQTRSETAVQVPFPTRIQSQLLAQEPLHCRAAPQVLEPAQSGAASRRAMFNAVIFQAGWRNTFQAETET